MIQACSLSSLKLRRAPPGRTSPDRGTPPRRHPSTGVMDGWLPTTVAARRIEGGFDRKEERMAAFEKLDTDVLTSDHPAIAFVEDNQTWTISTGVLASSSDDDGVFSAHAGSRLVNNGSVLSGAGRG